MTSPPHDAMLTSIGRTITKGLVDGPGMKKQYLKEDYDACAVHACSDSECCNAGTSLGFPSMRPELVRTLGRMKERPRGERRRASAGTGRLPG
jgi:hypothetical protein